jgi:hypothetical protein
LPIRDVMHLIDVATLKDPELAQIIEKARRLSTSKPPWYQTLASTFRSRKRSPNTGIRRFATAASNTRSGTHADLRRPVAGLQFLFRAALGLARELALDNASKDPSRFDVVYAKLHEVFDNEEIMELA